jgi:hypothetical protein
LRNAVVHYRAIFNELLEVSDVNRDATVPTRELVSHT